VGLIGSNGAGKSTLVAAIAGSVRIDGGRIELIGEDVTDLPAHVRARMGLGRVFQDARLFGDLTVRESVMLALEARERSELVPSMLGLPPSLRAERRKEVEAAELISFLGLERYADFFVSDLSTGTRRITELACLGALRPRMILLDEPTAGVAQREAEAFGPLIVSIASELGATLVLIEHDIPLVMSISDRVYCLEAGAVISEGKPDIVRKDPRVIAAYLGTDERAIRRSDAARKRRRTRKAVKV
jgi:ABC-type branched-subunit amino acid transport system ATPase component